MKILAIETSCDETALAIVEAAGSRTNPKFRVLHSIISSQVKIHEPFGGVVPNLAKREHLKNLPILLNELLNSTTPAGGLNSIDLIAVTVGPGLEPALWAGIEFAKALGKKWKRPVMGANHMEGHLYSFLLPRRQKTGMSKSKFPASPAGGQISKLFPAIALIVSGGHTILLLMKNLTSWKKLGETRDDAAGEAFDKVARLLGFPYPGGPQIEKAALRQAQGKHPKGTINFPRPMINDKSYDFSFSGLKTSVLYYLKDNPKASIKNTAASFEEAVIDVLTQKTVRAAREFGAKAMFLSGGVAANKHLKKTFEKAAKKIGIKFFAPDFKYNTDNAAMIAAAAYFNNLKAKKYRLIAKGNLGI